MADPLGSLEKIVKLALRIKEAVDTVRQNTEECLQIRKRAVRVSSLLSRLPETGMTADPAMCDALEDLEESLRRAHTLVAACQETTTVCIYCTAGRQAKRLRRVHDDISQKMMLVVFATNIQITIILTNIQTGQAGRSPPAEQFQAAGDMILTPVVDPRYSSAARPDILPSIEMSCGIERPRKLARSLCMRKDESSDNHSLPSDEARADFAPTDEDEAPTDEDECLNSNSSNCNGSSNLVVSKSNSVPVPRQSLPSAPQPPPQDGLRKFSLSELEVATHHFSVENVVGSGACATVYKGVLHDGLVVAIKKFRSAQHIDELHFVSKLKHKNIVKLIGYGPEVLERAGQFGDAKVGAKEDKETSYFIVEEYMPNGSLNKIINGLQLGWTTRFLLIQGIAQGLCYLHKKNIVHLDVKPSNILLDSDMYPKITDFGIANVLNRNGVDTCSHFDTVAGTLGYMPPEYITDGMLSKKHDVYGFGVTLLEVISGMSRSKRASIQSSIQWAWEARQAGAMTELLEPSLFDTPQLKEIERCLEVGLLCTQFDPADRPDVVDALEMLRGEKPLRPPVRPGYAKELAASWVGRWSCLRVRL